MIGRALGLPTGRTGAPEGADGPRSTGGVIGNPWLGIDIFCRNLWLDDFLSMTCEKSERNHKKSWWLEDVDIFLNSISVSKISLSYTMDSPKLGRSYEIWPGFVTLWPLGRWRLKSVKTKMTRRPQGASGDSGFHVSTPCFQPIVSKRINHPKFWFQPEVSGPIWFKCTMHLCNQPGSAGRWCWNWGTLFAHVLDIGTNIDHQKSRWSFITDDNNEIFNGRVLFKQDSLFTLGPCASVRWSCWKKARSPVLLRRASAGGAVHGHSSNAPVALDVHQLHWGTMESSMEIHGIQQAMAPIHGIHGTTCPTWFISSVHYVHSWPRGRMVLSSSS